jgi:hypothetical protein
MCEVHANIEYRIERILLAGHFFVPYIHTYTYIIINKINVFIVGILEEDVCKNSGTPLTGNHQKCDCPTGFKGFDCSEKGDQVWPNIIRH